MRLVAQLVLALALAFLAVGVLRPATRAVERALPCSASMPDGCRVIRVPARVVELP